MDAQPDGTPGLIDAQRDRTTGVIELELAADADTVAGLSRLKALNACREGRTRTQSVKVVWHDSPEHALLAGGQALSEQRGVWRLERILPGTDTWLPAQPAPVVTEAPDLALLPSPLAPLAAFEGRRSTSVHRFGDEAITLTAEKGILRAVTSERPAARIRLSGEEQAVRAAAALIAAALPVSVPLSSLAAEAIAMATGQAASARHAGAPVLPDSALGVSAALSHILGHLIDVILANAPRAKRPDEQGAEAVHQMRVAGRRARSALSIFRPAVPAGALDAVNALLKDLGARLGPTRDWDVFADETAPAILAAVPGDKRLQRLAAAAGKRRGACRKVLAAYLAGPEFGQLGIALAWFVAARFWHPPDPDPADGVEQSLPLTDFAGEVLQDRWKKLISAGKGIDELDVPSLHGVRLRAKRARYAAEMFAPLHQGKSVHRFIRRLSVLQQRLGVLNDGAVATHLLAELGGPGGRHAYATGVVVGFLAARSAEIRPPVIRAFEKFRRQPTFWS
jgi:triphosphatase